MTKIDDLQDRKIAACEKLLALIVLLQFPQIAALI